MVACPPQTQATTTNGIYPIGSIELAPMSCLGTPGQQPRKFRSERGEHFRSGRVASSANTSAHSAPE